MRRALLALGLAWLSQAHLAVAVPLRLVPVDDAALASVVLLGAGPTAPVLLVDPQDQSAAARTIATWPGGSECLARAGTPPAVRELLARLAGAACVPADDLLALARRLWPAPPAVVLAPAGDYAWLLRGAALAAAQGAALLPVDAAHPPAAAALAEWHVAQWIGVGGAARAVTLPAGATLQRFKDPARVVAESVAKLGGDLTTVVIANPADRRGRFSPTSLSLLAPL
ncbi:MAG: hypothetical protein ABI629_23175, partial [bacterium]